MGCGCGKEENSLVIHLPKDYKELRGQFSGIGIKRTTAWSGSITSGELLKMREHFWRTRTTGIRQVWMHIRQAVEADAETAVLLLEMAGVLSDSGSMQLLFDVEGNRYEIPAYILNDPSIEKAQTSVKSPPKREEINIKLRKVNSDKDEPAVIDNFALVSALKMQSAKENSRLFFGGKELENDKPLWTYNLRNNMVIQVYTKN